MSIQFTIKSEAQKKRRLPSRELGKRAILFKTTLISSTGITQHRRRTSRRSQVRNAEVQTAQDRSIRNVKTNTVFKFPLTSDVENSCQPLALNKSSDQRNGKVPEAHKLVTRTAVGVHMRTYPNIDAKPSGDRLRLPRSPVA